MTQPDTDVLIIGAGLSGIGAAVHLGKRCPGKSYRIFEQRSAIGGTWDLFRYPGIRSDSDMHTLGFNFKPWTEAKAIADGPSIRKYVNDTADEYDVREHITFDTKIVAANWSSVDQAWHVTSENTQTGARADTTARFLFMCGGYYRYDTAYRPDFPGEEAFKGQIVHPQFWPEDLDYSGKKVVIIGSGATAMTLVPAMTDKAAHVTMLQRSPTYVVSRPAVDKFANWLRGVLPDAWAYGIIRWRNVLLQQFFFRQTRKHPDKARERLLGMLKEELPDYDIETHFTPHYNPWEQRLCLVPDSDLFNALKSGAASVETDHIDTFTETGIRLKSGKALEADVIVTATGLQLQFLNGVDVSLDGVKVNPGKLLNYKGVMLSNMPNLACTFGYTNASWTLKADLTSEYVCRLIGYMDQNGYVSARPRLEDYPEHTEPFVDFSSGYFQRVMDQFPRQHTEKPWKLNQNYSADLMNLRYGRVDDGVLEFTTEKQPALQAAE
ncbi:MAG: NAD(P)/FAD-dependent oxidoreductase [Hyphomonas sp.]|uniref:flavin-containing monooxygenase n=1 Tax=Hyphomonas sp. TaxID=87 RepID=UPI00352894EB